MQGSVRNDVIWLNLNSILSSLGPIRHYNMLNGAYSHAPSNRQIGFGYSPPEQREPLGTQHFQPQTAAQSLIGIEETATIHNFLTVAKFL